jgi:hypothetical protein
MIPTPSKRPFRHPVPIDALDYFCHPVAGHMFEKPAWGRDSKLYVSNCHIALRFFNFTAAQGHGPMAAVDRLLRQRWHTSKWEDPKAWRKLDDVTLDLFREGVFPLWKEADQVLRYRVDPCVRINHGALVPLVSLQAVSRLPRCELYTKVERGEAVAFRFNGGEGLIAQLTHAQELRRTDTVCHLFPSFSH